MSFGELFERHIDIVMEEQRKDDLLVIGTLCSYVPVEILHSNRSCKPISMGQMDVQKVLFNELSVPSVRFDADHMDGGKFSMAQFQTRIDAFMEMLLQRG